MRALACLVALLLAACATSDTPDSAKSSTTGVAGPLMGTVLDRTRFTFDCVRTHHAQRS